MTSLLRQIVAGPRLQHPEAGLDLCYVTDFLIATSGPSSKYPKRAYRNPTDALVRFLDSKHDENWAIWEFRAEGTGYPDSEVYGRIHHFPWPDHHPPPFALIPAIIASMRNWLNDEEEGEDNTPDGTKEKNGKKVAVVHCKAGKGRSGTVACSYLISQEGWKMKDALQRFTERRMRVGFGEGVSILSQIRWIGYVNRWTNDMNKIYVERPVEILEVHIWGLRDGVKVAIEGYVNEGKTIKCFHLFKRKERFIVDSGNNDNDNNKATTGENTENTKDLNKGTFSPSSTSTSSSANSISIVQQNPVTTSSLVSSSVSKNAGESDRGIAAVILRPEKPVILPTSDVNIDFERRIKAVYSGWAVVTSIAHVWFNPYFEGGDKNNSGVFECEWDGLDGIKGSTSKGTRALERVKVVWRYPSEEQLAVAAGKEERPVEAEVPEKIVPERVVSLPKPGEPVHESSAADWHGENVIRENDAADQTSSPPIPLKGDSQNVITTAITGNTNISLSSAAEEEEESLFGANYPAVASATAITATAATAAVQKVGRELGLRKQTDASRDISLASSIEDLSQSQQKQQKQNQRQEIEEEKEEEEEEENQESGKQSQDGSSNGDIEDGVKSFYKE